MPADASAETDLIRSWLSRPSTPWRLAPLFLAVFWVIESAFHSWFFGTGTFIENVLRPAPHELWMRSLIAVAFLAFTAASSAGLRERRRRVMELESYQHRLSEATARAAYRDSEARRVLSDRLHEGVGQDLAAARLFLASASKGALDGEMREALTTVQRILDRTIAECRDLAQELSPPVLDEYGLAPALEALARNVTRSSGISVKVDPGQDLPTPVDREALLSAFHVLTGVVHGAVADEGTTAVRVGVKCETDAVVVSVSWDAGTRPELLDACARMIRVGGSIETPAVADGSMVNVRVPLAA